VYGVWSTWSVCSTSDVCGGGYGTMSRQRQVAQQGERAHTFTFIRHSFGRRQCVHCIGVD
jgi:hypothetical protein